MLPLVIVLAASTPYVTPLAKYSAEYFAFPVTFMRPSTRLRPLIGAVLFSMSNYILFERLRMEYLLTTHYSPLTHSNQFIRRNRQLPYPFARRVKNRAGHCGGKSHNRNLADTFGAHRVHHRVFFTNKQYINLRHVGIGGYVVFGKITVYIFSVPMVDNPAFHQRHADAPHNAANDLAAGGNRVKNSSPVDSRNHAAYFNLAGSGMNIYLDEMRAKSMR